MDSAIRIMSHKCHRPNYRRTPVSPRCMLRSWRVRSWLMPIRSPISPSVRRSISRRRRISRSRSPAGRMRLPGIAGSVVELTDDLVEVGGHDPVVEQLGCGELLDRSDPVRF